MNQAVIGGPNPRKSTNALGTRGRFRISRPAVCMTISSLGAAHFCCLLTLRTPSHRYRCDETAGKAGIITLQATWCGKRRQSLGVKAVLVRGLFLSALFYSWGSSDVASNTALYATSYARAAVVALQNASKKASPELHIWRLDYGNLWISALYIHVPI